MNPTLSKRLESLFRDLMEPSELRRFIGNLFGRQITSQLPEVATHELLAHGTVRVLDRNGLINEELFVELVSERPGQVSEIEAVARGFGLEVLTRGDLTPLLARPVRTPDYVVRDTYESLRRQRTLLRELTHGDLHLGRFLGVALRGNEKELAQIPDRVAGWIDSHRHEFTIPQLSGPLEAVALGASTFAVDPEFGMIGLIAAVGLGGDKVLAQLNQLYAFANLSDPQIYELTLTLVGTQG